MFWEILKLRIRGVTIPYCSKRKKVARTRKISRDGNSKARKEINRKHGKRFYLQVETLKKIEEFEGKSAKRCGAEDKGTKLLRL